MATEKERMTTIERFLSGEVTKVEDNGRTIKLSNGETYNKRLFHQILQVARRFKGRGKPEPKGGETPSQSLRYIIVENVVTLHCKMVFANTSKTSHSELMDEHDLIHGKDWTCIGGGFYTMLIANALNRMEGKPPGRKILLLFGRSDTYGLSEDSLKRGVTSLDKSYTVLDDMFQGM